MLSLSKDNGIFTEHWGGGAAKRHYWCLAIPPAFLTPEVQGDIPSRCSVDSLIVRMPLAFLTLGPDPPWSFDIRLITIWPCPFSLSSVLFFCSPNHWSPVSLNHCIALAYVQESSRNPTPYFLWIFLSLHGTLSLRLLWLTTTPWETTFLHNSTPDITHWGGRAVKDIN